METKREKILTITLKGDEIDNFKSAVKKVVDTDAAVGFGKQLLSEPRMKVFKELNDSL